MSKLALVCSVHLSDEIALFNFARGGEDRESALHQNWNKSLSDGKKKTRQSKQCGFSIYTFDNLKSKSMVRLVRAEKMVLSGLVFARKIARMILVQNI